MDRNTEWYTMNGGLTVDKSDIVEKLKILRSLDPDIEEPGADAHDYRLEPAVSEEQVSKFEQLIHVRLPEQYRDFLIHIGNGGAGPSNGLYPIDSVIYNIRQYGFRPERFAMEFPFTASWHMKDPLPDTAFPIQSPMQGTIPIGQHGYAQLIYLVITGAETGKVWEYPDEVFSPMVGKDGKHLGFADWYMDWLNDRVVALRKKRGLTATGEIDESVRWKCPQCGYSNLNQYTNCYRCYSEKKI